METPELINPQQQVMDIYRDWSIATRERKPGAPERIDGMTIGIVSMTSDPPHGGESTRMATNSCTSSRGV